MSNFSGILASGFLIYLICLGIVMIIRAAKSGKGSGFQQRIEELESDVESLVDDLEEARQRIEVLEKIVTDEKYNLNKEIDGLA